MTTTDTTTDTTADTPERFAVSRIIDASPAQIFDVLTDPAGHVRIDSSGMLQSAEGERVRSVGDTFVVHMDRESLGDLPIGKYDVTVIIEGFEQDAALEWSISGRVQPPIEHRYGYRLESVDPERPQGPTRVTSYYDWSQIREQYRGVIGFPIIPEAGLRATLGILARTVEQS